MFKNYQKENNIKIITNITVDKVDKNSELLETSKHNKAVFSVLWWIKYLLAPLIMLRRKSVWLAAEKEKGGVKLNKTNNKKCLWCSP